MRLQPVTLKETSWKEGMCCVCTCSQDVASPCLSLIFTSNLTQVERGFPVCYFATFYLGARGDWVYLDFVSEISLLQVCYS